MSLSDYLLRELTFLANHLTWDEYFDLVDREGPIATGIARLPAGMIVLDASAVVDLLVDEAAATAELRARLRGVSVVHVPHVLDVEVASGLWRQILRGRINATAARRALRRFGVRPFIRWEHTPLLGRALALRDRLTAADAMYVALAEALGATLLTRDARMAHAGGHRARIEVV